MKLTINDVVLDQEKLKKLLNYDPETGLFTCLVSRGKCCVGSVAGYRRPDGYVMIGLCKAYFLSHRLAWFYVYGFWPRDELDHINRIKGDDRISNLREATTKQNMENITMPVNNTTGFKGVTFHKQKHKWMAQIHNYGKNIYLGLFHTPAQAAEAYSKAAARLHTRNPNAVA